MQEGCYLNYYQPMSRITKPMTPPPSDFETAPGSPTSLGTGYMPGYLKTQIGKHIKVTFQLGTNLIQDLTGVLEKVGINYIILIEDETKSPVLCDIYSIQFVEILKNMSHSDYETARQSPTSSSTEYIQGYLKTQIGKRVKATFLLGTNLIKDLTGILETVGISYIILIEDETKSPVLCDIYAIKFVNIFK
jgi:predicted glycosyltransferase